MKKKVNILLVGPSNVGKSRIANCLGNLTGDLPINLRSTLGLRIVEYELNNIEINGNNNENIDVQLWDTSGDDNYSSYWPVYRKYTDGIVFVYSQNDNVGLKKLDYFYNFFMKKSNFTPRNCLVCAMVPTINNFKLSNSLTKISQIVVDLESDKDKFKTDFTKYVVSLINTLNEEK